MPVPLFMEENKMAKRLTHQDIASQLNEAGRKVWNTQTLRTEIRKLTKEANFILLQNEERADYKRLASRIQGATDSKAKSGETFVGRLNYKTMEELEMQLKGLQQFIEYDTLSDKAKRKHEERFQKYKQSMEELMEEELSDEAAEKLAQQFSVVHDIMEPYGSENVREFIDKAKEQGIKINLLRSFEAAENYADKNGIVKSPENLMDIVYAMNGVKRT